jgi:energy-coupling factor transporter ATP-binding protein EcfA2
VVGLRERAALPPVKLSGGEQQRVAIAHAIVSQPQILVLDEPTTSLDGETGRRILAFVHDQILNDQRCILIVTHDARIFDFANRMCTWRTAGSQLPRRRRHEQPCDLRPVSARGRLRDGRGLPVRPGAAGSAAIVQSGAKPVFPLVSTRTALSRAHSRTARTSISIRKCPERCAG